MFAGPRLSSVVRDVPKPMAPINGHPFLEWFLAYAAESGVDHFVFAVSHMREIIENHFKNAYRKTPIDYSVEQEPLGTGGAIRQAIGLTIEEHLLVANGDTLYKVNFSRLMEEHISNKNDLTIAIRPVEDTARYGRIVIADGCSQVMQIKEKGIAGPGLINGGVYCIRRDLLDSTELTRFSFETEIMEKGIGTIQIGSMIADDYFIDIGIPDDYTKAQKEFIWPI